MVRVHSPETTTTGAFFSRAIATTTPLTFVAGEGAELIADDGRRYLDFISGYGATNTGHCHPRVVRAIQEQASRLLHVSTVGSTHQSRAYAERLCGLGPIVPAKLFLTNSGTEAVEAALKLARYATGRPNILSFGGGFHGRTMGSLSVTTSKAAFRAGHEPFVPGSVIAPYPRRQLAPTLEAIEQLFAEQALPSRIAACLVEPVLGEGGYVVPPAEFLPALRQICDTHGILLIMDEVQSGFGRTGRLFACEHSGIVPDLITAGKGIASGLPMGALIGRADLMDSWQPGAHGNTFGGNPVVCAAAMATLDVIEDENLIANAEYQGARLKQALEAIAAQYPSVLTEVRGLGLMIGLELPSKDMCNRLRTDLLDQGVIVSTAGSKGSIIRLAPPLILTDAHVERFLAAVQMALANIAASA